MPFAPRSLAMATLAVAVIAIHCGVGCNGARVTQDGPHADGGDHSTPTGGSSGGGASDSGGPGSSGGDGTNQVYALAGNYRGVLGGSPGATLNVTADGDTLRFVLSHQHILVSGALALDGDMAQMTAAAPFVLSSSLAFDATRGTLVGNWEMTAPMAIQGTLAVSQSPLPTYDGALEANGVSALPRLVEFDYVDPAQIGTVSLFRSSAGHDFPDDFEACRSMKHYFGPDDGVAPENMPIRSPVTGRIAGYTQEEFGFSIAIEPDDHAGFWFNLFHVGLDADLVVGQAVVAGQRLGQHCCTETISDMAVWMNTPQGMRLVSYFDVMPDSLFSAYQARGVASRAELILSKEQRDAEPLECPAPGDYFTGLGTLPAYLQLN